MGAGLAVRELHCGSWVGCKGVTLWQLGWLQGIDLRCGSWVDCKGTTLWELGWL